MDRLVSIITVNYNQTAVTCEFLESVKKLTYSNYEVIVVDNASLNNPKNQILNTLPTTKVIISKTNLGFSGGNNLGINVSKGDFLFFVNNDTVMTPTIIEDLLQAFREIPNLGLVSPMIHYFGSKPIIQFAGFTKINSCTARNSTIGQFEIDSRQYNSLKPTPYAHGAAMMVTREVIVKVGLMPELFFLYYEELDWSEQIKKAGFEIYFQPKALIYHKESVSVGEFSPLKTYYLTRNRILFMRRNSKWIHLICFYMFFTLFTIPKNIFMFIIKLQFAQIKAFLKGILWNVSNKKNTTFKNPLTLT
jgi:GT2 family glycosyltransferase